MHMSLKEIMKIIFKREKEDIRKQMVVLKVKNKICEMNISLVKLIEDLTLQMI